MPLVSRGQLEDSIEILFVLVFIRPLIADVFTILTLFLFGKAARAEADSHRVEHHVDSPKRGDSEESAKPGSLRGHEFFHEQVNHISLQLTLEVVEQAEEG